VKDAAAPLVQQLSMVGAPTPAREYRFGAEAAGGAGKGLRMRLATAGLQDWRFDIAWPHAKLAVEVDGGGFVNGGHNRGAHMESDCAKLSTAVAMGWRVLRVTPRQVKDGRALKWVEAALAGAIDPAPPRYALDHCS